MRSEQSVYVEHMIELCRGTPLFEPDPGFDCSGPQIGDVGYIHEAGRFIRIFNIFSSTTNTSGITIEPVPNSNNEIEIDVVGVPAPAQLKLQELLQVASLIEGEPYKSKSVLGIGIQAGIEG